MRKLMRLAAALVAAFTCLRAFAVGGALDPTFGTGGVAMGGFGSASSVALQGDGKIAVSVFWNNLFTVDRFDSAGQVDASFGAGGRVTTNMLGDFSDTYAIVVQPGSGRIVAGGDCDGPPYFATDFCLAAYDSLGSLDATFGVGGKTTTDFALQSDPSEAFDRIAGLALRSDGSIAAGGWCQGGDFVTAYYAFCVARYLPNGTLDTTFGGGRVHTSFTSPPNDDEGTAVAVDPVGNVVVVGMCHLATGIDFCVARYDANGNLDPGFGVGGKVTTDFAGAGDQATAVAAQADGRIVVAGYCYALNPNVNFYTANFCLARYNTDGSLDPTFGIGGKVLTILNLTNAGASGLAIQPADGKLVVVGTCYVDNGGGHFCVARYDPNGSLDATFGTNGLVVSTITATGDAAAAVTLQPDGKILVAGSCGGHACVARYLPESVDNPPTDIALSTSAIAENLAAGTTIGTLSTTDPDPADTFTYSLVAGVGSTDNGAFTIGGNTLRSNAVFDFETQSSYSVRVRSTDSNGLFVEKVFAIGVTDVNEAPVAVNDAATTSVNNSVVIDVLSNDSDPDGDVLRVTATTAPAKGSVAINAGASVTYTPKKNYTGPDAFIYTISDGRGGTATASVAINVVAGNAPPRAVADKATTAPGTPVIVAVVANDTDPDGDALTIVALTQGSNGTVGNNGNGTLTYTPLAGFTGRDTFNYTISDGRGATAVGKVTVRVK